jgi:hypothetical protein
MPIPFKQPEKKTGEYVWAETGPPPAQGTGRSLGSTGALWEYLEKLNDKNDFCILEWQWAGTGDKAEIEVFTRSGLGEKEKEKHTMCMAPLNQIGEAIQKMLPIWGMSDA